MSRKSIFLENFQEHIDNNTELSFLLEIDCQKRLSEVMSSVSDCVAAAMQMDSRESEDFQDLMLAYLPILAGYASLIGYARGYDDGTADREEELISVMEEIKKKGGKTEN